MCKTTRQTKAAVIERTIMVTADDDFGSRTVYATVLERHVKKTKTRCECDVYTLERQNGAKDFGPCFVVHKAGSTADGEVYNVSLSPILGETCDCPWGCYTCGKPCRHIELCREAIRLGLI